MKRFSVTLCLLTAALTVFTIVISVEGSARPEDISFSNKGLLYDSISNIVSRYPGEIGVALIIDDTDTVTVNNLPIYPMMSVFKLHQAVALCDYFDSEDISLDTIVNIRRSELNPLTWSPMLKDHPESILTLTVRDLLRYTLTQSDNNASNLLFTRFVSTQVTDSIIATLIPRRSFSIVYTEEEMSADHDRAYSNFTSPLGAAGLINRLFTDSLVSEAKKLFLCETLKECITGNDRIAAPLIDKQGIVIAHKTGSGYTKDNGILVAHNDVAFITLYGKRHYSLAVFVKDFSGTEKEAAGAIAEISHTVYTLLTDNN